MGRGALMIAAVAGLSAGSSAWAEPSAHPPADQVLAAAAFAPQPGRDTPRFAVSPPELDARHPFLPPEIAPRRGTASGIWSSGEVIVGQRKGAVDSVRLSVREDRIGPSVAILSNAPYDTGAVAVRYTRGWPRAVSFNAGGYDLAVTPHAGLGLSSRGTSAEAGAMVRLSPGDKAGDRLRELGVSDGSQYGDEGRWYLFAAASGRAVGLNMTRADGGGWSQSGWSTDKASRLVGDGQLGVGFRKGPMQAAFGYVYREIKVQNGPRGADNDVSDSLAAFSLSIRP